MQKLWKKHQKFLKGDAGFSLVELIIVIAIMAALIAILAPQYMKYVDKSRKTADSSTADEVFTACKVAITDESIDGSFTVTWDGDANTLTVSGTDADDAADLLASSLGLTFTSNVATLTAKYTGATGSDDYEVDYTAGSGSTEGSIVASGGWW